MPHRLFGSLSFLGSGLSSGLGSLNAGQLLLFSIDSFSIELILVHRGLAGTKNKNGSK